MAGLWRADDQWLALELEAAGDGDPHAARLELAPVDPPFGLTPRELDVVTLMTGGLSNDDIGALLGCGGRTVGKHVERILAKTASRPGRASPRWPWSRACWCCRSRDRGVRSPRSRPDACRRWSAASGRGRSRAARNAPGT